MSIRIAYFITPHGFGHAGRSCAVMEALHQQDSNIRFDIYTTIPEWFFNQSPIGDYIYHPLITDVGLVQITSIKEDFDLTLKKLADYKKSLQPIRLGMHAEQLRKDKVKLVLADISPMGILAGISEQIPVCLVENFTWDWIYEGYLGSVPNLQEYIDLYEDINQKAPYRIQTEPLCSHKVEGAFYCPPIARKVRTSRLEILNQLGLPVDRPVIMITMGGIPQSYGFINQLNQLDQYSFILPGVGEISMLEKNVAHLPHHSQFFHPDLINASDLVVGKAGYSTIAEVYQSGTAFGYILRPGFRESGPLDAYIQRSIPSMEIKLDDFETGRWLESIPEMLNLGPVTREGIGGSTLAARYILNLLNGVCDD